MEMTDLQLPAWLAASGVFAVSIVRAALWLRSNGKAANGGDQRILADLFREQTGILRELHTEAKLHSELLRDHIKETREAMSQVRDLHRELDK